MNILWTIFFITLFVAVATGMFVFVNQHAKHLPEYVTYHKNLTKRQRDFLYGYFSDKGMTLLAKAYLDE